MVTGTGLPCHPWTGVPLLLTLSMDGRWLGSPIEHPIRQQRIL